jgi:hypothetical protein
VSVLLLRRQNFVKNCRLPPWRQSPVSTADRGVRPDLCSPVSVSDLLLEQQCFVLVCLLEAGLIRVLTLLSTTGDRVRETHEHAS